MKCSTPIRVSLGVAVMIATQACWAVGTDAGTVVQNTAQLDYSIGGTPQTQITSAVSDFTVDRKVDLTVTGDQVANYIVAPKSGIAVTDNELKYTLKNEGNSTQAFEIAVSHLTSEDFDGENCQVEVKDSGGTTVTGGSAVVITGTKPIVDIPEDAEYSISVKCEMPDLGTGANEVSDGELSTLEVLATAVVSTADNTPMAESTTDAEDAIDTVLADGIGGAADVAFDNGDTFSTGDFAGGNRNASHSAVQTYEINAPQLSVVKTSEVITDPVNCTQSVDATDTTAGACGAAVPKRIPGAVIEYTMTITNTSDAAATGVTLTDVIDTDGVGGGNVVSFVTGSITNDGGGTGTYTSGTETVTVTGMTVPDAGGGGVTVVKFRVKID